LGFFAGILHITSAAYYASYCRAGSMQHRNGVPVLLTDILECQITGNTKMIFGRQLGPNKRILFV